MRRINFDLNFWYEIHFLAFIYFLKIAILHLIGKYGTIRTEERLSNGGFRFFVIVISKLPVSSKHTYKELE